MENSNLTPALTQLMAELAETNCLKFASLKPVSSKMYLLQLDANQLNVLHVLMTVPQGIDVHHVRRHRTPAHDTAYLYLQLS